MVHVSYFDWEYSPNKLLTWKECLIGYFLYGLDGFINIILILDTQLTTTTTKKREIRLVKLWEKWKEKKKKQLFNCHYKFFFFVPFLIWSFCCFYYSYFYYLLKMFINIVYLINVYVYVRVVVFIEMVDNLPFDMCMFQTIDTSSLLIL